MRFIMYMPLFTMMIMGCANTHPRLKTVENVELKRFMGPWYVIAQIPTPIETKAYNSIEKYTLNDDGTVATEFTFNKGSLDGPVKRYHPRGFVVDKENNSTWGMQFIWPLKSEYLITYLNSDYTQTIISRNKRDYVWIMARESHMQEEEYNQLLGIVKAQGYDLSKIRQVPHDHGQMLKKIKYVSTSQ